VQARAYDQNGGSVGSAPVLVTVAPPTARAGTLVVNSMLAGDWAGTFGTGGYLVVNDSTNLPPTLRIAPTGIASTTWEDPTAESRALGKASGPERIAAAWTAPASATIDVEALDGQLHRFTAYFLDWDSDNQRVQRVELLDASSGAVLSNTVISNFSAGVYLSWPVRGELRLRLTSLAGLGAVVSGFFFDGQANLAPIVTLTSPSGQTSLTAPVDVLLAAEATDVDGTIDGVQFFLDGRLLSTVRQAPYAFLWTNALAGNHQILAAATDNLGDASWTAPAPIAIRLPRSYAGFVRVDTNTAGNWIGAYGRSGWLIPAHATNWPESVSYSFGNWQYDFLQLFAPSVFGALQSASGSSNGVRVLSFAIANNQPLTYEIHLLDGQPRRLALYFFDPGGARNPDIQVTDVETGKLLDSRSATNDLTARYFVWSVQGRVRFAIDGGYYQRTLNAVFLDPETNPAPVAWLTAPTNGYANQTPLVLRLAAEAGSSPPPRVIEFHTETRKLGETFSNPAELYWEWVPAGGHTLFARAIATNGTVADSSPVNVSVGSSQPGAAEFIGRDEDTRGLWRGVYGQEGWMIALHATNLPTWLSLTLGSMNATVVNGAYNDGRALLSAKGATSVQSIFYSRDSQLRFEILDGRPHRVALYFVAYDTDHNARLEVRSGTTGELLESRDLDAYSRGIYVTYELAGSVTIRLVPTKGDSLVELGGLFFDPGPGPFALWQRENFDSVQLGQPEVSGEIADPDQDGLRNVIEYVLGANPLLGDASGLPRVSLENDHLKLVYRRNKNATDLSLSLDYSSDLRTWSPAESRVSVLSKEDQGFRELVTLRVNQPVSQAGTSFFRLRTQWK